MVDFDPITHTYSYRGMRYTGASSLYSYFVIPFEPVVESIRYAKKHGKTPEYWQAKWAAHNSLACERGQKFHDFKEGIVHNTRQYSLWTRPVRYIPDHELTADYYKTWADGVYTEVKLWHHGLKLAGRCDTMIIETVLGNRYAHLDDYKTNKEIETESFMSYGNRKMMLPPVAHLMDCNYWHYTAQLSTYQLCTEFLGFKPGNRRILHYPQSQFGKLTGKEDFVTTPEIYDLPYIKKDVISMANHLLTKHATGK